MNTDRLLAIKREIDRRMTHGCHKLNPLQCYSLPLSMNCKYILLTRRKSMNIRALIFFLLSEICGGEPSWGYKSELLPELVVSSLAHTRRHKHHGQQLARGPFLPRHARRDGRFRALRRRPGHIHQRLAGGKRKESRTGR